jgi:uncharacterized membrane protein YfcA
MLAGSFVVLCAFLFALPHKPLPPLDSTDKLGFLLAALGLVIAAGGGIGGGGVLVPIYILVMGFAPKAAIPLSNVTVFGGAVANTLLNVRKRHPAADRPLVDWDLILVMEPLTIAGALAGAFINKLLPEVALTASLVALLSCTAYKTLGKAVRMYSAETRALGAARESELSRLARVQEKEAAEEEGEEDVEAPSEPTHEPPQLSEDVELSTDADLKHKEERSQILEEERHVRMRNVQLLMLMFSVVLAINLAKGGGAFSPFGIRCGSPSFWIANGVMLVWILLTSVIARGYLVRRWEAKARCGFPYVEGDIQWDRRATVVYPFVCTAAGFFAGMFGVGGGIVKGPLMLAMGVHPQVSSATSACMILFTSFTATTSFVAFGLLDMEYAGVCLGLGFAATLVGQVGLSYLMKKFQRNSYIAFSIGGIVALSAFLMTLQSVLSMVESGGGLRPPSGLCTGMYEG